MGLLIGERSAIEESEVGIVVGELEFREREDLSKRSEDERNKEAKLSLGGCTVFAMRL